mgnify:CR=1 FL=1
MAPELKQLVEAKGYKSPADVVQALQQRWREESGGYGDLLKLYDAVVAGGSAGLAAAFNTPLGGIVFAVEELSQQHFNRFKTFLISAVIVSGLVAQWILGPYLYLGYPKLNTITFSALPWSLAVGVIAGLGPAGYRSALRYAIDALSQG